ncbi:MAG: hypothetical protein HOV80_22075 [Polyangiaceae bacterium]|nr:hypothetical protein [Polyangiaceae bacterium]
MKPWHWFLGLVGIGALVTRKSSAQRDLGMLVLEEGRKHVGTRESGGHNRGPVIDSWNTDNGTAVGSNYCANAIAAWVRAALGALQPRWLTVSPTARVWMSDAQRAGTWVSAARARQDPSLVRPGMFAVWDRSQQGKPETAWWGHIGLVNGAIVSGSWPSLEANSGPTGEETLVWSRTLSDPKLYGFGSFS